MFAATEDSQIVAARVLEYSIRKHTPRQVEFDLVRTDPDRDPSRPEGEDQTPDAFALHQLTRFHGRALHLRATMQVFADLSEMYETPFDGHTMLCTPRGELLRRSSDDAARPPEHRPVVMLVDHSRLLDGSQAAGGLEEDRRTATGQTGDVYLVPASEVSERIPVEWNGNERYDPDETRLVHYASVSTQPWKNDGNPLRELWMESFREALAANAIDPELVIEGIAAGHLDPGLRGELHHHPGWSRETDRLHRRLETKGARLEKARAKLETTDAKLAKARADTKKTKRRYRRAKARLRRVERTLAWRGQNLAASVVRRALETARPARRTPS